MKTAVVVITCAKFQQAWDPFFILLERYWSSCPFDKYMITDYGKRSDVNTIEIGRDFGFTSNLIHGLSKINADSIIYFQEDYFAIDYFETDRILKYIDYFDKYNIGCLRLAPCPGPDEEWEHDESLGIVNKGSDYRVSTQTAIWKMETLKSLLIPGEAGGKFEIKGTERSNKLREIFLSVWRYQSPAPYYITGIVRGVWQKNAIKHLEDEGIPTKHIRRIV